RSLVRGLGLLDEGASGLSRRDPEPQNFVPNSRGETRWVVPHVAVEGGGNLTTDIGALRGAGLGPIKARNTRAEDKIFPIEAVDVACACLLALIDIEIVEHHRDRLARVDDAA